MTAHTYRLTLSVPLEIRSEDPRTVAELTAIAEASGSRLAEYMPVGAIVVAHAAERYVAIEQAWCTALNRRNSIDGQLYQCSMAAAAPIHGTVDAYGKHEDGGICDESRMHHAFVSPGFDSPADDGARLDPVAVTS